ncbi:hypothetical protein IEO21_06370 [Rhodonia placenta]|uniref:Uncharacterized protein n=1 Tax=Rhodonia placenta TaxID=104341 RepID=A0A8H7P067_9APHY|nr:hypothetical protein IEO21_06370 [Postia placenta]
MSAEAQSSASSEDHENKWIVMTTSGPERIMSTLGLGPKRRRNRWGDTERDIDAAVTAAAYAAMKNIEEWHKLVHRGVIDRLCEMVTNHVPMPKTPEEDGKLGAVEQESSTYFGPLEALCNAAFTMPDVPRPTDLILINTLRRTWNDMIKHLWNNPQNTLMKGDIHVRERRVIPQLIMRFVTIDPTFLSVIDDDADLTISLLTRYLMHATTSDDGGDITRTLIELVSPGTPVLAAYRETYPAPTNALTRMVRGASSIEQILAKTAVHFATLPPEGAAIMPEFIMHMYLLAKAQQPAFIPKFWRSSGLWAHLFATMRKAAKEAPLGALQEFPWDSFFLPVLGVAGDIFSDCWENDRSETYSLLALWVRTDFFGAIDAALPRCVTHVRVTRQLCRILAHVHGMLEDSSVIELLRPELPRPRALRALVEQAFAPDGQPREKVGPRVVNNEVVPEECWDRSAWDFLYRLQEDVYKIGVACRTKWVSELQVFGVADQIVVGTEKSISCFVGSKCTEYPTPLEMQRCRFRRSRYLRW